MADRPHSAVRFGGRRKLGMAGLAASIALLLLATELPFSVSLAGGGTSALAELLARSPGARVGGVALKAKTPAKLAAASPAGAPPGVGRNSVLSPLTAGGPAPEGAIPNFVAPGAMPSDLFAPAVPGPIAAGGRPPFGFSTGPGGGGSLFVAPGGGGGGGGGGGTGILPPPGGALPTPTPTPTPSPTGTTPSVGAPVPEPATWLMLIVGFGAVGSGMRRRCRIALA